MKTIFLSLLIICTTSHSFGQSKTQFTKQQVTDDLEYLYTSLQKTHYNIHTYTTKETLDTTYQTLKNSLQKETYNLLETTSIFQRMISAVNNGHTEIDFPAQSYINYAQNGGTIFPLEIAFENGNSFVRKNWSATDEIPVGAKILSINGQSMETILAKIYPQVSAERLYFKHAKIEVYSFPRYYWQVFGQQDEFEVEIETDNRTETYTVKAIQVINDYEMKRTDVLNAQMKLEMFRQTAYLNPGNFSGDEAKYQQFMDSAFQKINSENIKNLIIDLRNNGGGNDSFSDYLVSYIADKPFRWSSKFEVKASEILKNHIRSQNNPPSDFSKAILSHENGAIFEYKFEKYQPQPLEKRFTGLVFVLVNRQSHSQATVTATQIQDYGLGMIIGEETGEYSSLCASQLIYKLPITGISVKVSKGFMTRPSGILELKGVQPDIVIKDHLLDENDEILEETLRIIAELR
ncbi:peptidase S41-like protein [Kordia periserrulae]|uniref:Peptidase S41-like protein n=1 Tax=Kordia periserrulae TaxID=701523 RepID=A0A2T6C3T0_9FLAO|nr:S41 family peptidase [Kordia periserrulae]PTX62980.1 peptidase S41-like protein [Kordia periserrulae]